MQRWTGILLAFWAMFGSVTAQSLDELSAQYSARFAERNYAAARPLWREIYAQAPRQAALLPLHLAVLTDPADPSEGAIDTLIFFYATYRPTGASNEANWLIQRAAVARDLPTAQHATRQIEWTIEALEAHPSGQLDHLLPALPDQFKMAVLSGSFNQVDVLQWWSRLDRYLYRRELPGNPQPLRTPRRHAFRAQILDAIGGCSALGSFSSSQPDLRLLATGICPISLSYSLSPPQNLAHPGWGYRIIAAQAYSDAHPAEARKMLSTGAPLESDPWLRADMYVQLAGLEQRARRYRSAQNWLRQAQKAAPDWSVPYLELARLYISGSRECGFNAFDQKAVYWLALDQVQAIRERQRQPDEAVNALYFDCQKRLPTAEDLQFMGLQIGDTYPVRCWMNAVTTVRLP